MRLFVKVESARTWKHFNFPTLVTWRSFLTSRAQALAGDAEGQGARLLVTSDCDFARGFLLHLLDAIRTLANSKDKTPN